MGRQRLAGWLLSLAVWAVCFAATWFFGGVGEGIAANYICAILLAFVTLGERAGLLLAVLSLGSTGFVTIAETDGFLPTKLNTDSPTNAWFAVGAAMLMTTVLYRIGVRITQKALIDSAEAMAQRQLTQEKFLRAQRVAPHNG